MQTGQTPTDQLLRPNLNIHTAGDVDVQRFLENFSAAVRAGNIDEIMAFYSPRVVAFDMMPPLSFNSKEQYREVWEKFFTSYFSFPVTFSYANPHIILRDDIAFCYSFIHMKGDSKGGETMEAWMRSTLVLQKEGDRWFIIHEHNSVPTDPETDKSLMNLRPEEIRYH